MSDQTGSDAPGIQLDYDGIQAFCERTGLAHLKNPELQQVAIPRPMREGFAVRVVPRPERNMCTFAYPLPIQLPLDRLDAFEAAANRMNGRTFLGAWVVNRDTREIYFRQTVFLKGATHTDESVEEILKLVVGTVEIMLPKLNEVLHGKGPDVVLGDLVDAEADGNA
jgi:hypothetical protein